MQKRSSRRTSLPPGEHTPPRPHLEGHDGGDCRRFESAHVAPTLKISPPSDAQPSL